MHTWYVFGARTNRTNGKPLSDDHPCTYLLNGWFVKRFQARSRGKTNRRKKSRKTENAAHFADGCSPDCVGDIGADHEDEVFEGIRREDHRRPCLHDRAPQEGQFREIQDGITKTHHLRFFRYFRAGRTAHALHLRHHPRQHLQYNA